MGGRLNLGIVLFLPSFFVLLPHHKSVPLSYFYSPFYMYRAQSLSLHSPLIISGGPLNPQCLAHKRCSLCEQEGRAHALSFSVLCGMTASLAFLVFSFLCVFFFFFFETSWVLFVKLIARQVCPVVQPTALHLSISCLTHLLSF